MEYYSREIPQFSVSVLVYKSRIYCQWLGFSKFRKSFKFVTPMFHFIIEIFFKESDTSKRSTKMAFCFRSSFNFLPHKTRSWLVPIVLLTSLLSKILSLWHSNHQMKFKRLGKETRFQDIFTSVYSQSVSNILLENIYNAFPVTSELIAPSKEAAETTCPTRSFTRSRIIYNSKFCFSRQLKYY